jgi:P-type Cu+ transporter
MAAVDALGPQVSVIKPVTTHTDPVLELSYLPAPPSLSIRTIMSAIASAGSPEFKVSIHEKTSLEDLARRRQAKEKKALLRRLVFAFITAIPTFVITILFGSLVKDSNAFKKILMEPMWTGNTSRMNWALFFLATPVMFYSANLFHQRSIKEIRALWRWGSTTPIWKRFVRFGSMNLLVRRCASL